MYLPFVRSAFRATPLQEEPVLKAAAEISHGPGELRLDTVAATARRRGVVRLVENEKASRQHRSEPLAHRVGVDRVDQEALGDEEPAVRAPGVHPEAALTANPRQVGAVENLEDESKALFQLSLPLFENRRRRGHHNGLGLLAQEQLARDESGLDRLAQPCIISDKKIDARQPESLAEGLHLVGVDLDPGPERRLKKIRIGCRHTVPAQRVQEGSKLPRRIKPLGGKIPPALFLENPPIELIIPEHIQGLALRVVVCARQAQQA